MCAFAAYSRYILTSNNSQVGYHNEHHDFPAIPWTRLPALRELAPEFYDTIPSHPSWPMVMINFIRDPDVGMFSRVKRLGKAGREVTKETLSTAISKGTTKDAH
jgi:hypothetical protein